MNEKKQTSILIATALLLTVVVAGYSLLFASPINIYTVENTLIATQEELDIMPTVVHFTDEKESIDRENFSEPESININTCEADELTTLSGIGEALAQRIIDYRESYGEFSSIESLMDVKGIGKNKLENIREYITID